MGMSAFYTGAGTDDAGSIRTIHRAVDLGVTFFDTAEVYGPYANEELLGKAFAGKRDQVVIATKFGTLLHRSPEQNGMPVRGIDGSPENIRIAVEGSLRRLGTDRIDLYYQHRMDPRRPSRTPSVRSKSSSRRGRSSTTGCRRRRPRRSDVRTRCIR